MLKVNASTLLMLFFTYLLKFTSLLYTAQFARGFAAILRNIAFRVPC